jgi:hypothetical protein
MAFGRVFKIAKSDYQLHVCPAIHMEKFCFHWTGFYKTSYLSIFRKHVEKIQVSFKIEP